MLTAQQYLQAQNAKNAIIEYLRFKKKWRTHQFEEHFLREKLYEFFKKNLKLFDSQECKKHEKVTRAMRKYENQLHLYIVLAKYYLWFCLLAALLSKILLYVSLELTNNIILVRHQYLRPFFHRLLITNTTKAYTYCSFSSKAVSGFPSPQNS